MSVQLVVSVLCLDIRIVLIRFVLATVSILHKCGSSTKPSIRTVTSWPASPNDMKVPSVLAYDFSGNVIACGAEALLADRNKCTLVEHFKLHLHPADIKVDSSAAPVLSATSIPTEPIRDFERTKLPSGVKIVDVYSTFIKYLYQNAKAWFEANTLSGEKIWENSTISLIFAMPDGHGEFEFAIIRNAFVTAGICSSIHDQRLEFIREAEAVVHFALESVDWLQVSSPSRYNQYGLTFLSFFLSLSQSPAFVSLSWMLVVVRQIAVFIP